MATPTAFVDTPPVVTVSNLSATHGQEFAASSLFTASDADGDAITTYAFWNSGTGGGHFLRGGVALHANQEIDVTAAELSGVGYQPGLRRRHPVGARLRRNAVERLVGPLHGEPVC